MEQTATKPNKVNILINEAGWLKLTNDILIGIYIIIMPKM